MMDLLEALNSKKIIFTDYFSLFKNNDFSSKLSKYNFIVADDDVVTHKILKSLVRFINSNNNSLVKVYVNPHTVYEKFSAVYTHPPPQQILINHTLNKVNLFKYPFHKLLVNDHFDLNEAVFNLENLSQIEENKVYTINPIFTLSQNVEILMHKLLKQDVYLNRDTYNSLNSHILKYKNFKNLEIEIFNPIQCNIVSSYTYTPHGFDLTKHPNLNL